jgi:hypothetical protein
VVGKFGTCSIFRLRVNQRQNGQSGAGESRSSTAWSRTPPTHKKEQFPVPVPSVLLSPPHSLGPGPPLAAVPRSGALLAAAHDSIPAARVPSPGASSPRFSRRRSWSLTRSGAERTGAVLSCERDVEGKLETSVAGRRGRG